MRGIQHRAECSQPEPLTKPVDWLPNGSLSYCPECGRAAVVDAPEPAGQDTP